MVQPHAIDKQALKEVWDEILSVMQSMETDKQALKNLKAELGTVIGAENSKETNALIKALLLKQKENAFYDVESISDAEVLWDMIEEND